MGPGCYAVGKERLYGGVARLVAHNLELLRACGDDSAPMGELLGALIDDYRAALAKAETKYKRTLRRRFRGVLAIPRIFRIHWDGDFFSVAYAYAWRAVILANPDIQFWAYTRSLFAAPILADLPNLTLYLSVDRWNRDDALKVHAENPEMRLAFCGETWAETEELAEGYRRGPRCPELTKKVPLVTTDGRGACQECGLCISGVNNVRFAIRR